LRAMIGRNGILWPLVVGSDRAGGGKER
jgi:hypothetical protein